MFTLYYGKESKCRFRKHSFFIYKLKLTPLHVAVWRGFLPLAAALLQAGAHTEVTDANGILFIFIEHL